MSKLLDQLRDEEEDFTVRITDTDGMTGEYEFLDIVLYCEKEYAVLDPVDGEGYVDIFRIVTEEGKESYVRVTDDAVLEAVFEVFKLKNEDEYDFD